MYVHYHKKILKKRGFKGKLWVFSEQNFHIYPKGKNFKQEEDTITLDLSKTFEEYVNQMGTAGEYATVGSVVNTYLDAYDAKAVSLLVEGGTWSTGHAEYETLQGRYTYDAQE